ncbi:hypothetical protein KEM48_005204 [Puccinia striiformis f. sp. tritici PST-130]|nr:hypothetical protein KEM48_005204 [Puccinia striiformis f. sp. tritici PST-130]
MILVWLTISSILITTCTIRSLMDPHQAQDLEGFSGPSVSKDGRITNGGGMGKGAGSCRMSWMNPGYLRLDSVHSRLTDKYSLFLYRESGLDVEEQPSRSPVLYIPGNAGSFRQIRSLGSTTSHLAQSIYHTRGHPGLDFFTLDFNDDFSAFHGQTLLDQAEYTNDAIRTILSLYTQSRLVRNSHLPVPTSVLILAHSMGGIVARKSVTLDNHPRDTINTIISLSSPHSIPPLTFDTRIESVYEDVNRLWREHYSSQSTTSTLLKDMILVSISGGSSDTTISSDSSSLTSLAPSNSSLTIFTTGIPGVWTPIDHLAIMWCNQLTRVIANALLDITDPRIPNQVKKDRLNILKKHLILGHGISSLDDDDDLFKSQDSDPAYHLHPPYQSLRLTKPDLDVDTHIIPLPSSFSEEEYEFNLLSSLVRLKVLVCNGTFEIDALRSCHSIHSQFIPRSQFNPPFVSQPGPNDQLVEPAPVNNFIQIHKSQLSRSNFLAIQVYQSSGDDDDQFLISEFKKATTPILTSSSFLKFSLFGQSIRLHHAQIKLVNQIQVRGLKSSLIAYQLKFSRGGKCRTNENSLFAPLMKRASESIGDIKYFPNIKEAVLYTHLSNAYTPTRRKSTDDDQIEDGVGLTFWIDPLLCSTPKHEEEEEEEEEESGIKIEIKLDINHTLKRIILRYRTGLISFPVGLLSIILGSQFSTTTNNDRKLTTKTRRVGGILSKLVTEDLVKILAIIGIAQTIQSIVLQRMGSGSTSSEGFQLVYPPRFISDLLLGLDQFEFILLDWCFIFLSIGWIHFLCICLHLLLRAIAHLWIRVSPSSSSSSMEKLDRIPFSYRSRSSTTPLIDYQTLVFLLILAIFITSYAPYHFGFLILTTIQLVTTFQYILLDIRSRINERKRMVEYNLTVLLIMIWISPISITTCLVWLRNLQEGWYAPFPDGRNVFKVIGFMGLVYLNRIDYRSRKSKISLLGNSRILEWMFKVIGLFSILYGIRYTFKVFEFLNLGFMFLCLMMCYFIK